MSATEVIELIKKLSPEEQEEVHAFFSEKMSLEASAKLKMTQRAIETGRAYMERHPELFRKLAQ